jgi:type I restriction enzyme S subunit
MSSESPAVRALRAKVPERWQVASFVEVTDFQEGPGILAIDFQDFGTPLLRLRNIQGTQVDLTGCNYLDPKKVDKKWAHFRLEKDDLLISTSASLGRVSIVPPEAVGAIAYTGIIRFRACTPRVHQPYLRAFLSSALFVEQAESMATGSVMKHFGPSHLRQMAITIPTAAEQVQIAEVFDALDNRIIHLRESNATLEAIAQALFKSWFVDFDPVRAKMEGRIPEGMDEATAALFPDGFEESELALVPQGWCSGQLGEVARTVRKQLQPTELHAGLHYVGLEHMPRKSLSLVDWATADGLESAKAAFREGDVLFGKLRPYFHKVVIAPFDGVCSTDVLVCQAVEPAFKGFVAMQLFSDALIGYAERLSNGAKMPRVNWSDLADYPVVLPTEDVAARFTETLAPLFLQMKRSTQTAQTLASLRDTLLPRLISGQLRPPENLDASAEEVRVSSL